MNKWLIMLAGWIISDWLWWRWADRRLRFSKPRAVWRWALGLFMGLQLSYAIFLLVATNLLQLPEVKPVFLAVCGYIWHFFVLPVIVLVFSARWVINRMRRKKAPAPLEPAKIEPPPAPSMTRRQVLTAMGTIALPPMITASVAIPGTRGLGQFRVRDVVIHVPTLPPDLDGLSIAQISDLHIGRFLPDGTMERVAQAANAMQADLVVFTGDLLDASCDGIKPGHEFIKRLDPRGGMVMIEGNHDVMHGSEWFEKDYRQHNLLLDDNKVFKFSGRKTPVQLMGITWGDRIIGRELGHWGKSADEWNRVQSEEATERSVRKVAAQRIADAFPILLAHHPHALDTAAAVGLPLVLAGHTHGGQIMLTKNIGAGPLRFKYWAGEYEKTGSKLFVNNGVGNWFPLRVGAPSEIVKIILRSA